MGSSSSGERRCARGTLLVLLQFHPAKQSSRISLKRKESVSLLADWAVSPSLPPSG